MTEEFKDEKARILDICDVCQRTPREIKTVTVEWTAVQAGIESAAGGKYFVTKPKISITFK